MKSVRVAFFGGPEDGLVRTLPEPLIDRFRFPRYGPVTVIPGMTTLPASIGRYIYRLDPMSLATDRPRYEYEGEE